jgi:signal peptidase II
MARKFATALPVAGLVVVVDQLTKAWALRRLPGNPMEVIPNLLSFEYTRNSGAAFGLFRNGGVVLSVVVLVAVGSVIWTITTLEPRLELVAMGAILGGAIGNVWDRFLYAVGFMDGAVVDWIKLPNFWNFNIADTALTVGVAVLLLSTWMHRDHAS